MKIEDVLPGSMLWCKSDRKERRVLLSQCGYLVLDRSREGLRHPTLEVTQETFENDYTIINLARSTT